ncbi:MAG TPA: SCP2 sterol-binding domain-containing protein [Acidimicrobiales bacterium]|nr:SCP2 sterol-binding domain-containing protein [Acidimicrobiales bacterium]
MDRLGEEWASEAAGVVSLLPDAPGVSGTVSFAVTEGTGKKRQEAGFHWRYEDGKAIDGAAGVDADADLVLLIAGEDAVDLLSGRVEPSVSFMRGRLKASGDGGLLLGFLRATTDSRFDSWRKRIGADL